MFGGFLGWGWGWGLSFILRDKSVDLGGEQVTLNISSVDYRYSEIDSLPFREDGEKEGGGKLLSVKVLSHRTRSIVLH